MKNYPSNISREQFELIKSDLENVRKQTKPRKYDLYDLFCALLYVLKSGCQWRMLPSDFPKWNAVYSYFQIWKKADNQGESVLERVLKKIGQPNTYYEWAQ